MDVNYEGKQTQILQNTEKIQKKAQSMGIM